MIGIHRATCSDGTECSEAGRISRRVQILAGLSFPFEADVVAEFRFYPGRISPPEPGSPAIHVQPERNVSMRPEIFSFSCLRGA